MGITVVSATALLIAGVAVALASANVSYEAGKHSKPPYVFLTVSHGKVTTVRWDIHEGPVYCGDGSGVTHLNAPIKHGQFSKSVKYTFGNSPLGPSSGTTTVRGTVSANHVTVRVTDEELITSLGDCSGSHRFVATKTARFH